MFKIDGPGAATGSMPARGAVGTPGWFEQSPGSAPGTVVTAEFMNMVQAEFLSVLGAVSIAPDKTNDGQLLAAIRALIAAFFPAGSIIPYPAAVPTGWLLCAGQSVLRADYPALFAVIGGTFGAVDGTHFTLPDLRGRSVFGVDGGAGRLGGGAAGGIAVGTLGDSGGEQSHTLSNAETPNPGDTATYMSVEASSQYDGNTQAATGTGLFRHYWTNGGPAAGHNNLPPALVLNWIIRT